MNLNKVIIVGRVTNAPELKRTPGGATVTQFGVATNRNWTDKATNTKKEEVEFHSVVLWGRTAEVAAQFLVKGAECLIEGRLQTRSWNDKTGAKHSKTEIVGEILQLGAKPGGAASRPAATQGGEEDFPGVPVIDLDADPAQPGMNF